jgi:hypothetical protein
VAKVFDATLKTLIGNHFDEWATFLAARAGLPAGPAAPLDTDLSVTLQADRLFRVTGPAPYVLHLELESNGRLGVPVELLRYNVAALGATDLPVHSVLVLLRPKANATDQTGALELPGADGRAYLTFRYTVVRVWQESVGSFLAAGPGLAPLAVLTNEAAADLGAAFERFRDRLKEPDVPANVAVVLTGLTFLLTGLRYDEGVIRAIYARLDMILEDSTTYQWVLKKGKAEGEADEARRLVTRLATQRLGPPPAAATAALAAVTDRERLERMFDAALDATGWDELVAVP